MCLTDAERVRLCLDGHADAFCQLAECHRVPLMRYLSIRLGGEEAAAEAAQETLVRAYSTLRKLKRPEAFRSWLLGIARRVAQETYRARRRRPPAGLLRREAVVEPDDRPDAAVDQAVADLPELYREVVLLRYYGGLSCAEVSRQLGVPVGTVTMRLSRAYAMLRKRLAQEPRED
jgi:RNA polymerase sigma-70 factor, ECF subfamily